MRRLWCNGWRCLNVNVNADDELTHASKMSGEVHHVKSQQGTPKERRRRNEGEGTNGDGRIDASTNRRINESTKRRNDDEATKRRSDDEATTKRRRIDTTTKRRLSDD